MWLTKNWAMQHRRAGQYWPLAMRSQSILQTSSWWFFHSAPQGGPQSNIPIGETCSWAWTSPGAEFNRMSENLHHSRYRLFNQLPDQSCSTSSGGGWTGNINFRVAPRALWCYDPYTIRISVYKTYFGHWQLPRVGLQVRLKVARVCTTRLSRAHLRATLNFRFLLLGSSSMCGIPTDEARWTRHEIDRLGSSLHSIVDNFVSDGTGVM